MRYFTKGGFRSSVTGRRRAGASLPDVSQIADGGTAVGGGVYIAVPGISNTPSPFPKQTFATRSLADASSLRQRSLEVQR